MNAVELLIALRLRNRFYWLALGLALYLVGQLSYWQWKFNRFDTLDLMGHLTVMLEAGLLAIALITALSTPALREAWLRHPRAAGKPFSHIAAALAGDLTTMLAAAVLLAPVLALHRYPELVSSGIHVPLMMLQRVTLLTFAVLITYHIVLLLRYYARLPWWLCGALGVAFHVGMGYGVTYLSFTTEAFRRLNDVFYYNELWRYSDSFPKLQRPEIFHNIEQPFFAYFISAALLWALSLLLALPGASRESQRSK